MINVDQVGRPFLDGQALGALLGRRSLGYVISPHVRGDPAVWLRQASDAAQVPLAGIPEAVLVNMGFASDSVPFGPHAPTLFLSTSMHDDYHKPTDTTDKLEPEQMKRAATLILAIIDAAAR